MTDTVVVGTMVTVAPSVCSGPMVLRVPTEQVRERVRLLDGRVLHAMLRDDGCAEAWAIIREERRRRRHEAGAKRRNKGRR